MNLFSDALGRSMPPPPWYDVHTAPQDLIIGIIGTFIGLVILFSIKPRLEIELWMPEREGQHVTSDADKRGVLQQARGSLSWSRWEGSHFRFSVKHLFSIDLLRSSSRHKGSEADLQSGHEQSPQSLPYPLPQKLGFRVTNKGLRQVVEVKARLFRIYTSGRPRHKIELVVDELFSIRGKLSERRVYLPMDENGMICAGKPPPPATWKWLLLRGLRVDDDVPAEQHAADDLPGVQEHVLRADGGGAGTSGIRYLLSSRTRRAACRA
jgi:hypothetical protein